MCGRLVAHSWGRFWFDTMSHPQPVSRRVSTRQARVPAPRVAAASLISADRKSTRLNSSHLGNSYAVFSFKKKESSTEPFGTHSPTRKHAPPTTRNQLV